ncbi:MAG TPA: hypothetical protein VKM72_27335 [Thermoanaerobaculia bacterium]|nr:hypothetical protein [Thermoanaerobaculia bacterium]
MDLNAQPDLFSLPWYEKAMFLFALFYPVIGILVARRRLASGHGSVVALATLPLTAGAVVFWLGLSSEGFVDGLGEVVKPLFVACLSTLLVLAGSLPYRTGGEERPRSTRLTLIVIGMPFVLAAAGLVYGCVLSYASSLSISLASTVLGAALVGLHVLTISLRVLPESRATAATVFALTVLLAVATWQFSQRFQLVE